MSKSFSISEQLVGETCNEQQRKVALSFIIQFSLLQNEARSEARFFPVRVYKNIKHLDLDSSFFYFFGLLHFPSC